MGILLAQKKQYPGVEDSHAMNITHLGVLQGYQGTHIGSGLMQLFQDHCRETGNTRITLGVDSLNVEAIMFYSGLGLAEYGKHLYIEVEP